MRLSVNLLTQAYAQELCQWRYDGPYAQYNFSDWDTVVNEGMELADATIRSELFRAVTSDGVLVGFFRMCPKDADLVELGLGLKPELCGQGKGRELVGLATQYTRAIHPDRRVFVEVRTFNLRAVRCYEKYGYRTLCKHREIRPQGEFDYYTMEYKP